MEYREGNNRFYAVDDNSNEIAEIAFQREGDSLAIIDHTFVEPAYRGKGIANHLFELVIAEMKKEGRKILPLCSFAVHQFETKPEYRDMLAEE